METFCCSCPCSPHGTIATLAELGGMNVLSVITDIYPESLE